MKRNEKRRLLLGLVLVGVLAAAAAIVFWIAETSRTSRFEEQALRAAEKGDWDEAYALAEKAEADGAMNASNAVSYRKAEEAENAGDFAEAERIFASLGAYRDAPDRVKECRYRAAVALEGAGEFSAARDAFWALVPYADAQDRYLACCYRIASDLEENGQTEEAFAAFKELIPYGDSEARAQAIAMQMTGTSDPEQAVTELTGETEERETQRSAMQEAREALEIGRIAAGKSHVVVLFSDGHAEAVGDGSAGQCDVAGFTNLKAVAAGYRHSLGLKADGTVVAAGDNSCGQCDVGAWTNVIAITCGAFDSYGIRADGTLLHAGFSEYDFSGWSDLSLIAVSETGAVGVRKDGMLLSTRQKDRFTGSDYVGAAVTNGSAFALRDDGTVKSDADGVSAWENVVRLMNSPSVLAGLRADGTLYARALLPGSEAFAAALSEEKNVSELALAGTFALIRHTDGTLAAVGDVPEQIAEFVRNTSGI